MEAAVVKSVVSAVVSPLVKTGVGKLLGVLEKKYGECDSLEGDIGFLERELRMIAAEKEDQLTQNGAPSAVQSISMEELRDLVHDIEDCLDRFLPCAACGSKPSFLDRLSKGLTSSRFASEIKKIKGRLLEAQERRTNYGANRSQSSTVARSAAAPSRSTTTTNTETLVGTDKPIKELLELLLGEGQPEQLKVISIVGFGGTGKTALAKKVYDDASPRFDCSAWVVASEHKDDTEGLLSALLKELRREDLDLTNEVQLQNCISDFLGSMRYLIVFDDIEEQQWDCIKSTFPGETSSRIIVTTTIQAVAEVCSQGNGYVYNMRTLGVRDSKDLLEAVLERELSELEQSLTPIVDKCDGHPLALVSVASYLRRRTALAEEVCRCLGQHMENEDAFTKLRQVITNNYSSLRGSPRPLKTCLQYLCVFPNGRPIRRNSLCRRWLAEGYVHGKYPHTDLEVAYDYFRELIDRNSIRPIDSSKYGEVKTCRTHGIMHEFMLHKSISGNFITSFDDDKNRSKSRHLFIQNPTSGSSPDSENFCARSLTINGNAGKAVPDLAKCELLRVLDLEECNELKHDYINDIHKLWHLKYLSLGSTISSLPGKINELHRLETLDLRKTSIETLPEEVMWLPHLAHLFGKIKLEKMDTISELQSFLSEKSTLETLSGFVVDNRSAFPQLMAHMEKMRKVKIWCDSTCQGSETWVHLLKAINKFVQDDMATCGNVRRSLSLYLEDSLENFIHHLENSKDYHGMGYLSSLKLHGYMSRLPQFVTSLCGLTDLCLSSGIPGNDLSNLRKLTGLLYLKLVQDNLQGFVITKGDFSILRRLCLVVRSPALPTIEKKALPKLVWLQLLCKDIEGLCDIKIEWFNDLNDLQEVALDCMVNENTIKIWRSAAKNHPKRPRVLLLKRVPTETEPIVKYVATEEPAPESHVVQSRSNGELNSASEERTFSAPSPATTELSSAGGTA